MDWSPAAQGRRVNTVVERKLDELCASLDSALSSPRSRSPDEERRLVSEIKTRTDFLRSLLVAEGECHGGERPAYLVEAKARFAVLNATFDQWARRVIAAPAAAEVEEGRSEEEDGCSGSECSCTCSCQEAAATWDAEVDADRVVVEVPMDVTRSRDCVTGAMGGKLVPPEEEEGGCSGSECSCTDSCQEAAATGDVEVDADRVAIEVPMDVMPDATDKKRDSVITREDVMPDAVVKKRDTERAAAATREEETADGSEKKRDAEHQSTAETRRSTVQRRWWRRSAAWCGGAGVVAVIAVVLALESAAVAHHDMNVYVVPT